MADARRRVCQITTGHHIDDHRILSKECATLSAAGYDVTLIAPAPPGTERPGLRVVPLAAPPANRARRMLARPLAAYRAAREADADVYHFHDADFLPQALRLARQGRRLIYDAHEDLPKQILAKTWVPPVLRRPASWTAGHAELVAASRLAAVIGSVPPIVERFRGHAPRVALVANFPRLDEIAPGPFAERERVACYVGDLSRLRGLVELVDAMEHVDGELELAGRFDSGFAPRELETRPGWARVRYHGRVGRAEVAALLRRAGVGVLPLRSSPNHAISWPVKLFEYMAAGLPVVATDVEPWNAIIARHRCGLCVPVDDPRALAAAITRVLDDPAEARAMGVRARAAAGEYYSWESQAEVLLGLYEELLR
jgi:glycosyltransferase involved in cell wall biosynthesis